jgi:hypothetical protein
MMACIMARSGNALEASSLTALAGGSSIKDDTLDERSMHGMVSGS